MKHLYRVVRCPKGAAPAYLPWHHLWLALGLTALGLLLGWLTMPLAAVSSPDLSAQDLWVWYMSSVDLWYRNLLPPVLLIWLLYFLTGRCWLSYLLTALPALGVALANYFKIQLRGDPLLASEWKLISEAGGIMGTGTCPGTAPAAPGAAPEGHPDLWTAVCGGGDGDGVSDLVLQ